MSLRRTYHTRKLEARSGLGGHTPAVLRLLCITLLLCVGCDDGPAPEPDDGGVDAEIDAGGSGRAPCARDAGPIDAGLARGLTNTCTDGFLLSGLGLRWEDGSHRLARWSVFPRTVFPEGCPPSSELRGASVVAELEGEIDGLDAPGGEVMVSYTSIAPFGGTSPPDAGMTWRGVRIARGTTTVDLPEDEGEASALFDLEGAGMADAPSVVVVLDGLQLTTDVTQPAAFPRDLDPSDGFATHGVGAWIDGVERDGTTLRFRAGARFAVGRSGDPALDRGFGATRTRAIVHWAVVALPNEPAVGAVSYRESHLGTHRREVSLCRPDAETTALTIEGPAAAHAAPALTSFRISLFPDREEEGDVVRELSLLVHGFAHDPASGRATMQVEGYATNEAPPASRQPMVYDVEASVALLTWDGGDPVQHLRVTAPNEPGRSEVELPLTRD